MLKRPVHILVLRCDKCKERFKIRANQDEDKYKCPHCGVTIEYECYRTSPIGPSEVK